MDKVTVPTPSVEEVKYYLDVWKALENYSLQESSLDKLFLRTYPLNKELDDVLIKVCALNEFYSTNIFNPIAIAKHIVNLNIDESLKNDNLDLVNRIALVKMKDNKNYNFYSFATKYCSHHKPTIYPIYDSFVEKMLLYFKKRDGFSEFSKDDLHSYSKFRDILMKFREFYGLQQFSLKEIDQYLWQIGKKYFPRIYKKKGTEETNKTS